MYYNSIKVINKKVVARQIFACLAVVGLFVGTFFAGRAFAIKEIGKAVFTDSQTIAIETEWVNPYEGLVNDEYARYIIEICSSLKLDPNIVVAVLLQENTKQDPLAVNKNHDGSYDCGLFQLNSKNLTIFSKAYWPFKEVAFDWTNWQHSTIIAVHLLNDLYKSFDGDIAKAVAAYNAGCGRVILGKIPKTTQDYQQKVLSYYAMLGSS